jgi:hypothetical protein
MTNTWFRSLILGAVAFAAPAATFEYYTGLQPEVAGATGTGFARFIFDTTAQTLSIDTNWSGLSGTTTVAHIHCCVMTPGMGTVGVAVTPGTFPGFPVGLSAGSYSIVLDLTQTGTYTAAFRGMDTPAQASERLLAGINEGRAYINIHSTTFPPGEIRGFLKPVPEPGTLALAGVALAAVVVLRRRG